MATTCVRLRRRSAWLAVWLAGVSLAPGCHLTYSLDSEPVSGGGLEREVVRELPPRLRAAAVVAGDRLAVTLTEHRSALVRQEVELTYLLRFKQSGGLTGHCFKKGFLSFGADDSYAGLWVLGFFFAPLLDLPFFLVTLPVGPTVAAVDLATSPGSVEETRVEEQSATFLAGASLAVEFLRDGEVHELGRGKTDPDGVLLLAGEALARPLVGYDGRIPLTVRVVEEREGPVQVRCELDRLSAGALQNALLRAAIRRGDAPFVASSLAAAPSWLPADRAPLLELAREHPEILRLLERD